MPYKSRLAVSYRAEVPAALLEALERHGRRLGLALETLEALGSDAALCRDFVAHAELGAADLFLAQLQAGARPSPLPRPSFAATVFDDGAFVEGV